MKLVYLHSSKCMSSHISFMSSPGSRNTVSECLLGHLVFGYHCANRERLVKPGNFLKLVDLLLVLPMGTYHSVQHGLIFHPETLDTAYNWLVSLVVLIGQWSSSVGVYLDRSYRLTVLMPSTKPMIWSDRYILLFWIHHLFLTQNCFTSTHLIFQPYSLAISDPLTMSLNSDESSTSSAALKRVFDHTVKQL